MKTARTAAEVREILNHVRRSGRSIGFVPTMGALHGGHASLVRLARTRTDHVVVSIFVNPKQFGPAEDCGRYPREEARDARILDGLGCDLLFAPGERDMYSPRDSTRVAVKHLSDVLCGASRPGHFEGVCLVVAKLFNIVQPDEAYFGQKDAQQAVIIQRMAADLDFPVRIVLGPTVREPGGLAMSSRNSYLTSPQRERASALYEALNAARVRMERGERSTRSLSDAMRTVIEGAGIDVDYAEIVDGCTLQSLEVADGLVLLAVAARIGGTRLIDNMALRITGEKVEEVLLEFPQWSRYGRHV